MLLARSIALAPLMPVRNKIAYGDLQASDEAIREAARAAYALLPNVQAFWLLDALDGGAHVPADYLAAAAAYAAAWAAAALALGCASFRRLEIAG